MVVFVRIRITLARASVLVALSQAATKEADSIPVLNVSDTQSFYVCSLSSRTITYKGQLSPEQASDELDQAALRCSSSGRDPHQERLDALCT